MSLEESIANVRNEFEQILQYVSEPNERQIHEVEKNIFQKLLKIGLSLLLIFIKNCNIKTDIIHVDKNRLERKLHLFKKRNYLSVFGKIEISRPYYWKKGEEVCVR